VIKIADAFIEVNAKVNNSDFIKSVSSFLRFAPAIGALSTSLVGLGTAALSLASSLGYSSLALAAAIPAAVGLGGAMAVLKLIFTDMEKGPLKNFAKVLADVQTQLQKTAQAAAAPGFNQLAASLQRLTPIVDNFVQSLARGMSGAAAEVAKLMDSPLFQGKLKTMLDESARGTNSLMRALDSVLNIIVTVGAAAAPIFSNLSARIFDTVEKFSKWVNLKYETGELQKTLKGAADEAIMWFTIVKNFVLGVVNLFAQGTTAGHNLATSVLRISDAFRRWTEDSGNQQKIRELIDWILKIDYQQIATVAAALSAMGFALKGLTIVSGVVEGIKGLVALGPLAVPVVILATAVAFLAGGFVLLYTKSQDVRDLVADLGRTIQEKVIPRLQEFWTWLEQHVTPALERAGREAVPIIRDALKELRDSWHENKEAIKELMDRLQPLAEFIIREGIPAFTKFAAEGLTVYIEAIRQTIIALGYLNGAIDTTIGIAHAIGAAFSAVADWITNRWNDLVGFIGGIPGAIAGALSGMWNSVFDQTNGVVGWLAGQVSNILGIIGRVSGALGGMQNTVGKMTNLSSGFGRNFGFAHGGVVGSAFSGGVRSGFTMVGEHGPELVRLPAGTSVSSNPDTERRMGGRAAPTEMKLAIVFEGDTNSAFATAFQKLVRSGAISLAVGT
jgi:hypothetical protein